MAIRYGQVLIDSYAAQLDRLFTYIIMKTS